jgi:MFS family permease
LSKTRIHSFISEVNRNRFNSVVETRGKVTPVPNAKLNARLKRTGGTWIAYLALVYFSLILNSLGPVTSLVRMEQGLTYGQAGLLSSSFASGLIVASLIAAPISRRLGPWNTLALAGAGLICGCTLICLAKGFPLVLAGALLAGTLGSCIISEVPLVLAEEHQQRSTTAFTEANALASASAIFSPAAVGLAERLNFGWRAALLTPFLLAITAVFIFVFARPKTAPPNRSVALQTNRLRSAFWLTWCLLFFSVAAEFTIIFWATDYFRQGGSMDGSQAAGVLAIFFVAMCLGRAIGSRLTLLAPPVAIVLFSFAVAFFGSFLYCFALAITARAVGLGLLGLGIANLYPTFLSLAISKAKPNVTRASARTTLASGLAILVFPFVVGGLADQIGLRQAQLLIPSVLLSVLFLFLWLLRFETTVK